ncbi:protein D1 [Folsomia candida]|uniref:OV-16 antigen n=1 Tax=Folsomia candida TaxID=158441 RepID=A0A226E1J3_FOLCA|nr:protein D1 [Folsomia candida]OXA51403.1 OV-16 antigen [Folsomia candida]
MERLLSEEIVPDVVDSLPTTPTTTLHVEYNDVKIEYGNQVEIRAVEHGPTSVNWNPADPHAFYSICLTDPDAPTRSDPKMRERVHWLVGNIPGDRWEAGETLIAYVPSCPPKASGLHRYTFVLLRQPGRLDFSGEKKVDNSKELWDLRRSFSIRKWAKKWDCEVIGANFYVAEWDLCAQSTRDKLGL